MTKTEDLYGLPLEEFVAARAALAKKLRGGGERERAQEVAGLRKPSAAAWTVNQLVRTQHREVAELFKAGDAVQDAQSQLLAGHGDPQPLREAVERERDAVRALSEQAGGLLDARGHELSRSTLDRVEDTLHAAALDREARAQVQNACLDRELRHVGLGSLGFSAEPPPNRSQKKPRSLQAAPGKTSEARRDTTEAGGRNMGNVKAARRSAADAERGAQRADRELKRARTRCSEAERTLAEAEAGLAAARERLAAAERNLEQAAEAQRQAQSAVERLGA